MPDIICAFVCYLFSYPTRYHGHLTVTHLPTPRFISYLFISHFPSLKFHHLPSRLFTPFLSQLLVFINPYPLPSSRSYSTLPYAHLTFHTIPISKLHCFPQPQIFLFLTIVFLSMSAFVSIEAQISTHTLPHKILLNNRS